MVSKIIVQKLQKYKQKYKTPNSTVKKSAVVL